MDNMIQDIIRTSVFLMTLTVHHYISMKQVSWEVCSVVHFVEKCPFSEEMGSLLRCVSLKAQRGLLRWPWTHRGWVIPPNNSNKSKHRRKFSIKKKRIGVQRRLEERHLSSVLSNKRFSTFHHLILQKILLFFVMLKHKFHLVYF